MTRKGIRKGVLLKKVIEKTKLKINMKHEVKVEAHLVNLEGSWRGFASKPEAETYAASRDMKLAKDAGVEPYNRCGDLDDDNNIKMV